MDSLDPTKKRLEKLDLNVQSSLKNNNKKTKQEKRWEMQFVVQKDEKLLQ